MDRGLSPQPTCRDVRSMSTRPESQPVIQASGVERFPCACPQLFQEDALSSDEPPARVMSSSFCVSLREETSATQGGKRFVSNRDPLDLPRESLE